MSVTNPKFDGAEPRPRLRAGPADQAESAAAPMGRMTQASAQGTLGAALTWGRRGHLLGETASTLLPGATAVPLSPLTRGVLWGENSPTANWIKIHCKFPITYFNYSVNVNWNSATVSWQETRTDSFYPNWPQVPHPPEHTRIPQDSSQAPYI